MRKINTILAHFILILLLVHAFMGCLLMLGFSSITLKPLSYLLLSVVCLHALLSILSSVSSIRIGFKSGQWYFKENASFWIKRITGIVILILIFFHISAYTTIVDGHFFLKEFTFIKLISQFSLVLAIFIHAFVSLKSMLIAKGEIDFKEKRMDWLLVISIFLIFIFVSIIFYYIQWQV